MRGGPTLFGDSYYDAEDGRLTQQLHPYESIAAGGALGPASGGASLSDPAGGYVCPLPLLILGKGEQVRDNAPETGL